jgi:pilus assembly protein TadC
MILTVCVVILTLFLVAKRWKTKKQGLLNFVVSLEVVAILWEGLFFINNRLLFDNQIKKINVGDAGRVEKLEVRGGGFKGKYEIEVPKRKLTERELDKLFDQAYREIQRTYLGHNKDASRVTEDLDLKETYLDGLVNANWKADNDCVSSSGKVENTRLKRKKKVNLRATLRCEGEEMLEDFQVYIYPVDLKTKEGLKKSIESELTKLQQKKDTREFIKLPGMLGNVKLKWYEQDDYKGFIVGVMGLILLVLYPFIELEKTLREKKYREQKYKEDYPRILQKLAMFVECGISVRRSFCLIRDSYVRGDRGGKRDGFEVIKRAAKQLENGVSELEVYRRIGTETENRDFKKLSYLLCQNLKGGNEALIAVLEREVRDAIDRERIEIKTRGEMISTKLILPLMLMLFMVMLILVVPGIWGINI